MLSLKLKTIRALLVEAIEKIDSGNSNQSEEELEEIIKFMTKMNRGIKRISKYQACKDILHCSASTFDKYVALGLIPKGHKESGFKELSWSEDDFDEATLYRINEYKNKNR